PQSGKAVVIQSEPLSRELLGVHRRSEIIAENSFHRACRKGALGNQASIKNQGLVRHVHPRPQSSRAQSDYVEQALGELVIIPALIGDCEPVLLPGPIEKRNQPVIKEVQEFPECGVPLPNPFHQQLSIWYRQHSKGSGQANESYFHLKARLAIACGCRPDRMNLAGRKLQGDAGTKSRRFERRWTISADRQAVRIYQSQQANRLEEFESIRLVKQDIHQKRICSPALAGHLLRYPSRCFTLAASWLNEFIEQYRPRKRSSTLANKKIPLPTNSSSSNSTVVSMPRTKPVPIRWPICLTTGRLSTLLIPEICLRVAGESMKSYSNRISRSASGLAVPRPSTIDRGFQNRGEIKRHL